MKLCSHLRYTGHQLSEHPTGFTPLARQAVGATEREDRLPQCPAAGARPGGVVHGGGFSVRFAVGAGEEGPCNGQVACGVARTAAAKVDDHCQPPIATHYFPSSFKSIPELDLTTEATSGLEGEMYLSNVSWTKGAT